MAPKFMLLLAFCLAISSPVSALWPLPQQLKTGTTPIVLANNFNIKVSINDAPQDLQDAVSQAKSYLKNDQLQRLVVGRGATDASAIKGAKSLPSLTLSLDAGSSGKVKSISEEAVADIESRDEAYTLSVPNDGSGASLKANSTLGLYRGLATFGQLWYDSNGATYTLEAPIQIVDAPAYVCHHCLRLI